MPQLPFTLETPIVMKQRSGMEMAQIQQWYDDTPSDWFPVSAGNRNPVRKIPGHTKLTFQWINNIFVKGEKFSHWYFVPIGNRYPGPPNTPETWQGWQKLEEIITPSTMRDEIRMARILIQYCDTEDDAVLKELKEWFAEMNEVQRACMAKSVRDRAKNCSDRFLYLPFLDLYRAIHEYDIAAKTDSEIEWQKKLELLE